LKILKKLRTASLNSEFTGSYKKVYHMTVFWAILEPLPPHYGTLTVWANPPRLRSVIWYLNGPLIQVTLVTL